MTLQSLYRGLLRSFRTPLPVATAPDATTFAETLAAIEGLGELPETETAILLNRVLDLVAKQHHCLSWGDRLLTIDKSAGFATDPAFDRALQSIRGSHRYDQYDGPAGITWRLNTLCWAGRRALNVGGDFVECGVFKGDMAWVVTQTLGIERIPHFYLYDSFEGFSPTLSSAEDFPDNPGFLEFANSIYRDEAIYRNVTTRFAPYQNVTVVKGFLPNTFDRTCPETIGFLHIDLNSPRAEIGVLERLFNRVVSGGAIVFDDYGWKVYRRQKEAEDAFMAARGHEILELPSGQGLVIKR